MFGVGTGEIVLILAIAMLVVGPERMVTFARQAGELIAKFRQQTDSVTAEFREALSLEPESTLAGASSDPAADASVPSATESAASVQPSVQSESATPSQGTPAARPASLFTDGELDGTSRLPAQASTGQDGQVYTDDRAVAIDIVGNEVPQTADEPTLIDGPQLVVDELDAETETRQEGDDAS